jgi:hypothetical protein
VRVSDAGEPWLLRTGRTQFVSMSLKGFNKPDRLRSKRILWRYIAVSEVLFQNPSGYPSVPALCVSVSTADQRADSQSEVQEAFGETRSYSNVVFLVERESGAKSAPRTA